MTHTAEHTSDVDVLRDLARALASRLLVLSVLLDKHDDKTPIDVDAIRDSATEVHGALIYLDGHL